MIGPEFPQIEATIPDDHSRKSDSVQLLSEILGDRETVDILDLGCGDGRGLDVIKRLSPGARYTGVDIETSPEVAERTRSDGTFLTYNGVDLPFDDQSFDVVYSHQVFEHVRHPDRVTQEVRRVLRPGGTFVGSMSNLEPYHSFSIFNYTPYGVFRLIADNDLTLRTMRPGAESTSLIMRQLSMRRIKRLSLIYPAIDLAGRLRKWPARQRNYMKLRFSGHICFIATRDT
ncbi:MAG: class I SAM-dependent methyltransferase [Pseudomonadota bacterium]